MSTANWWARKLNAPVPPPQLAPAAPPTQFAPQLPTAPANVGRKAPSHTKASGTCPECGGENYFSARYERVPGSLPAPRCFDCGYPVVQSTSGMTSTSEGGTAPSKQNNPKGHSQVITNITEHLS